MKKYILLTLLAISIAVCSNAQSATDNNPLAVDTEYNLLEATTICLDAIEAPTKYNEFAIPFISLPDFPKKEKLSSEELKKNITAWFKNNPKMVDIVRAERKKAHDILYGSRPY